MIDPFKQWVALLATPLVLALFTAIAALACFAFKRRMATWLFIAAAVIAYAGSIPFVGNALLGPLERAYPPLHEDAGLLTARYIVVLGSGYAPHDGVPITAALEEEGLVRIVEGVRLARRFPSMRLVVCGGARPGFPPTAHGYAELASSLGIEPSSIVVLDKPRDTAEEAQAVGAMLRGTSFVLVTSAYHMPRAMRLMRGAGAHPIAAPTGQSVQYLRGSWRNLLPSSAAVRKTEHALHEYLGIAGRKDRQQLVAKRARRRLETGRRSPQRGHLLYTCDPSGGGRRLELLGESGTAKHVATAASAGQGETVDEG